MVTSLVIKKEEVPLAFPTECSALDWVAEAQIFKLEILKNVSVHLKIITIRKADLGQKSGRHLDESANLLIYSGEHQECYMEYCLPVIKISEKQDVRRPLIVCESTWKMGNLVPCLDYGTFSSDLIQK